MITSIPTGIPEDIMIKNGTFFVTDDDTILTDEKGDYLKEE